MGIKERNVVAIRAITRSDAKDAAELSAELGYPVPVGEMEARIDQFAGMKDHAVYVASLEDRIVGWIDVGIVQHLQSGPYGEIGGLIVSQKYQGCGIGRQLIEKAEEWIAGRGVSKVVVRSQISRERAHNFYLQQNFLRVKTSAVFTKMLGG